MCGPGLPPNPFNRVWGDDGWAYDRIPGSNAFGIAMIACMGLGLGWHLHESQSMKSVARGIKFVDGVMKGLKAIHKLHSHTSELGMGNAVFLAFQAARALAKSAKRIGATRGVDIMMKDKSAELNKISKGIKLSEGALNLVRYSNRDPEDIGLSAWNTVVKGYKLSKGALNVFEGANGLQGRMASVSFKGIGFIKGGVEGVGVIIKTIFVSKQLYGLLIKGFGISKGAFRAFRILPGEYSATGADKTQRKICFQMRKYTGISYSQNCVDIARFSSAANEPLIRLLADALVSHRDRTHTAGSECVHLFYLSLPYRV